MSKVPALHPEPHLPWFGAVLGDRRGAIVVVSVFMCMFLVGCLWYLMGIGDAAIYRERLDAGADAAAYCAAVYHARGMNMIAMFNLLIAATIAVIIYAKGLDYVIAVAHYTSLNLCTAAGASDPAITDPSCRVSQDAAHKTLLLKTIISKAEGSGDRLLAGMSNAQREIAVLTPWVAATESIKAAEQYAPIVLVGAAVSPSMIPEDVPDPRVPHRLGLPVMEDEYGVTCDRAGQVAPQVIDAMVPGRFLQYINEGPVADVARRLPTSYCGSESKPIEKRDLDLFNEKDVCKETVGVLEQLEEEILGPERVSSSPLTDDECIEKEKVDDKEVEKTIVDEAIPKVEPAEDMQKDSAPEKKTGKRLVAGAFNGNDFFQVYSLLRADAERFHRADSGVRIATGERGRALPPRRFEEYAIAQAEFYYDQTTDALSPPPVGDRCWTQGRPCGLRWPEYEDNVLWNMRWRARLRLFRMPTPAFNGADILDGNIPLVPYEAREYTSAKLGAVFGALQERVPRRILAQRLNLARFFLER